MNEFENCTDRFKVALFDELNKCFPKWFRSTSLTFIVLKYSAFSIPCKSLCLKITADIRKTTNNVRRDLTLIFTGLSKNVIRFV